MNTETLRKSKRETLLAKAEAIIAAVDSQPNGITPEQDTEFHRHLADISEIDARIKESQAMTAALDAMPRLPDPDFIPTYDATGSKPYAGRIDAHVVEPKLVAFANSRDAFDCGLFFKARLLSHTPRHAEGQAAADKLIARRGQAWFATQNETSPTDGGYLVPPSFENAVVVYREQVAASRKLARVVQMGSDTWHGVKQTSGTTVYYPGEEGAITDSDANFSRYTLTAKKRAILAYVSSELVEDSLPSIMDILAMDMGHQLALQEDKEFVLGDGTSTYGNVMGIVPSLTAATASVYTPTADEDDWSELTLATHLAGMSLLADKYRGLPLSWLCSGAYKWQVMDRLSLAQGGSIPADIVNGQMRPQFLGYPVIISDRMPTTTAVSQISCVFGAFQNAVILGERRGLRVETSSHYKFNTDQIAVRATTRYDIHCHEEGSTTAAGAIVGIATHS